MIRLIRYWEFISRIEIELLSSVVQIELGLFGTHKDREGSRLSWQLELTELVSRFDSMMMCDLLSQGTMPS